MALYLGHARTENPLGLICRDTDEFEPAREYLYVALETCRTPVWHCVAVVSAAKNPDSAGVCPGDLPALAFPATAPERAVYVAADHAQVRFDKSITECIDRQWSCPVVSMMSDSVWDQEIQGQSVR